MKHKQPRVLVVGGGPAGLLAASEAAFSGADVILLEKGPKVARKLLITGKGRCNITNAAPVNEFVEAFGSGGKFLYSAFSSFFRDELIEMLLAEGVECKEERGGRFFPVSDKSQDVVSALLGRLNRSGAKVKTGQNALSIVLQSGCVTGLKLVGGEIRADAVVLCTGGLSYPKTGSTGDGYAISQQLGHTIVRTRPALAPLVCKDAWVGGLAGLALRNINVKLLAVDEAGKTRLVAQEFGGMLFTHTGVSGPVILTISRFIPDLLDSSVLLLSIDLKPALSPQQLHSKLLREFKNRLIFRNYLKTLLPSSLAAIFSSLAEIDAEKRLNQITATERNRLVELLKGLPVRVHSMGSIDEAIVTAGGVALTEIDSGTMMSKIVPGLFFAGEIMDIDAKTGGYNLQAAFSTGYVAGRSAAQYSLQKQSNRREQA